MAKSKPKSRSRASGSKKKKRTLSGKGFLRPVFASVFFLFVGGITLFFVLVGMGVFGPIPDKDELSNIHHHEASRIYSGDGKLIGTYFVQNRTQITLDEVNTVFIDALLATEDIRFYRHNGLDYRAFGRVFMKSILLRQNAGGGSTLTQQLAKNLYPRKRNGTLFLVADKIREMIIARRLESIYSKDKILELYLNTVSFGEEVYGIETASRRYFNKPPSDLQLHEAATLAGLLSATTWYNPHRNPNQSIQRRNVVIRQMEKYGIISAETAGETVEKDLELNYNRLSVNEGPAPYFREHLRAELRQILSSQPAMDGKQYNLYTDGLIIETTLDSRLQASAERAVATQMQQLQDIFDRQLDFAPVFGDNDSAVRWAWETSSSYRHLKETGRTDEEIETILHTPVPTELFTWNGMEERMVSPYDSLRHYLSFLNAGFIAMHPGTGEIQAWVGGINHRHFQYDHVKAKRQVGSTFKPVVYATALEQGMEPCDYQRNQLTTYADYDNWTPTNIRDEYGGRYSLQAALAQSVNTIAVDLLMETGIHEVRHTAERMGITSPIPAVPSIALGTAEVSLLELTTAYTTFLNRGIPATPRFLKAIYNSRGELIYDFSSGSGSGTESGDQDPFIQTTAYGDRAEAFRQTSMAEPGQNSAAVPAISAETAAAMVQMLSKAVNEGTGTPLRTRFGITHALAGKTGTTQNFTDGWFVGMTPDLVFGAWVGGSNPRVRFRGNMGYASQTALPVAGHFLNNMKQYPDLKAQPNHFYPDQIGTSYNLHCSDYRDDRITDRVGDFLTGRSVDTPRELREVERDGNGEEKKSRNIFSRIKRLFTKD